MRVLRFKRVLSNQRTCSDCPGATSASAALSWSRCAPDLLPFHFTAGWQLTSVWLKPPSPSMSTWFLPTLAWWRIARSFAPHRPVTSWPHSWLSPIATDSALIALFAKLSRSQSPAAAPSSPSADSSARDSVSTRWAAKWSARIAATAVAGPWAVVEHSHHCLKNCLIIVGTTMMSIAVVVVVVISHYCY